MEECLGTRTTLPLLYPINKADFDPRNTFLFVGSEIQIYKLNKYISLASLDLGFLFVRVAVNLCGQSLVWSCDFLFLITAATCFQDTAASCLHVPTLTHKLKHRGR
jgi:hypothetical protein